MERRIEKFDMDKIKQKGCLSHEWRQLIDKKFAERNGACSRFYCIKCLKIKYIKSYDWDVK